MSKKTELVEAILKLRKKENDIAESKHLYTLTNQQLEKIYNSESKRTEQEVLKDFEKLGYKITRNDKKWLGLCDEFLGNNFLISKGDKAYCLTNTEPISMLEHKLLTELFTIWGWLND